MTCDCFLGITLNSNFHDITDDIDDARVYGGIHFRFDQQAGARQGRRVGIYYRALSRRGHIAGMMRDHGGAAPHTVISGRFR